MSLQSSESDVWSEFEPRTLNVCFLAPMSVSPITALGTNRTSEFAWSSVSPKAIYLHRRLLHSVL